MATIPMWTRSTDIRNLALGQGCEAQWLLSHLYREELPDALWFILGTAVHDGIEYAILNDADPDQAIEEAMLSKEIALYDSKDVGVIESTSKRSKRNLGTLDADIDRLLRNWFSQVHPDAGGDRLPEYNDYSWPPRVEHQIRLPGHRLYTTVDAIFEGGPDEAPVAIVDWKSGARAKTAEAQLQVYHFGGLLEGWAPEATERIGWFHHIEAGKLQTVYDYVGTDVVTAWLDATVARKERVWDSEIIFNPDWWCGSCRAKDVCPVMSNASMGAILNGVAKADKEEEPKEETDGDTAQ